MTEKTIYGIWHEVTPNTGWWWSSPSGMVFYTEHYSVALAQLEIARSLYRQRYAPSKPPTATFSVREFEEWAVIEATEQVLEQAG